MKQRYQTGKQIMTKQKAVKGFLLLICLLVTVGILCIHKKIPTGMVAYAAESGGLTGDTTQSTVINPAGTAETPEELNQLNTVNTVTLTVNEDW